MNDELRIYGRWAGNRSGIPEDPKRCIHSVWDRHSPGGHQCTKPRGHGPDGLYCKVHDPAAKKARDDAAFARYRAKMDAHMLPHNRIAAMKAALEAIAGGHNDPRTLADETLKEWFKT